MRALDGLSQIALLESVGMTVGAFFQHASGPAPEDIVRIQLMPGKGVVYSGCAASPADASIFLAQFVLQGCTAARGRKLAFPITEGESALLAEFLSLVTNRIYSDCNLEDFCRRLRWATEWFWQLHAALPAVQS